MDLEGREMSTEEFKEEKRFHLQEMKKHLEKFCEGCNYAPINSNAVENLRNILKHLIKDCSKENWKG